MKNLFLLFLLSTYVLSLDSCLNNNNSEPKAAIDSTNIKEINASGLARSIKMLASDSFQGRKPFTKGETLSINFLRNQFENLNLRPGNGRSYFQDVPMVEITSIPGDLIIKGKNGNLTLHYLNDYVGLSRREVTEVNSKQSELVFAGFGIVAPEYHWNDYQGINVKGKTVVVMVNDPGFYNSKLFKGKTMTYYGRWTYKYEEAARQGAAGILIIHDEAPASYPWSVVQSSFSGSKLYLQSADHDMHRAAIEGWISHESAINLFKIAGIPSNEMDKASKPGFKPLDMSLNTDIHIKNTLKKSLSHNVIAYLKGARDSNQYIIYSAHWDHLGIGAPVKGDSIYNGAIDNASGCASMISIARAFSDGKIPNRSVVFIAVTAEEQGLLGSEYYALHPTFPIQKTIADINIDALSADGLMKDLSIIGYGQSELDDYVKHSAEKQGRIINVDPNPSAGSFFRSDHFNFAKVGIPALFIESGTNSVAHGPVWGKAQADDYIKNRYHQTSDNFDPAHWDFTGMVEDSRLLYDVGYTLANERKFPSWKLGSEFKTIREKSLEKSSKN